MKERAEGGNLRAEACVKERSAVGWSPVLERGSSLCAMHSVVKIDEKIGKTVGRRKIKDSLVYGLVLQKSLARIREESGFPRFSKGVFRFRSFEEADAWMTHYMTTSRDSLPPS